MTRWLLAVAIAVAALVALPRDALAASCSDVSGTSCGVNADQADGTYHGLIAVTGQPWVLNDAAHEGSSPGCGDCTWLVVLACPETTPTDPASQSACVQAGTSPQCQPGQRLFRLYLSTADVTDRLEGTICLGGDAVVVPIGDQAAAVVDRYMKDVTPPDLVITTRPTRITLAGLATYFNAAPPDSLRPVDFGGPTVRETITVVPKQARWDWGDGNSSDWAPADQTTVHRYAAGGDMSGTLHVRWSATYTVTYDGQTFGPYDANGQLTKDQPFRKRVATTEPVLVAN
jgi:hypothetical protein